MGDPHWDIKLDFIATGKTSYARARERGRVDEMMLWFEAVSGVLQCPKCLLLVESGNTENCLVCGPVINLLNFGSAPHLYPDGDK